MYRIYMKETIKLDEEKKNGQILVCPCNRILAYIKNNVYIFENC